MIQGLASCEPCRERRVVRHPAMNGFAANGVRLPHRQLPLRRVDDEVDLVVLDHVNDMTPAFPYLIYTATGNSGLLEGLCRSIGRQHLKPPLNELPGKPDCPRLVPISHADEAYS